ncbi:ABC transporter permease [Dyella silvatica]|uniref:ABC transporter permease n=1 Tax=Dyella silvatica TaxID=2992128 RepID=UPI00224D9501|nr:ABC transporter permease [Dyella silvatica]
MFAYYLRLAANSLKRNLILTGLTIATIAIGIGGSMSTYTIYYAMSGDPIPWKSSQLFVAQLDSLGPKSRSKSDEPPDLLSYRDTQALMRSHPALSQAAMYQTRLTVTPADTSKAQFAVSARATGPGFFAMFDTPFQSGRAWTAADEEARANVVVIGSKLAERLFNGVDAVGKSIILGGQDYRIIGVLKPWNPAPRFYDLGGDALAQSDNLFLPFTTAIDRQMQTIGHTNCDEVPDAGAGWQGLLSSNCVWIQYWLQLPTTAEATSYREFLGQYAADQQRSGRFNWSPMTRLRNVREWLVYKHVIPDEVRAIMALGFGFLLVCLITAIGLMLAKFSGRAADLGVRRALGASQRDLFMQCLTETALIGALGGIAGLLLTLLGAATERSIVAESLANVTRVDFVLVLITLLLAEVATVGAGIYPAWRASRIQPALQLKTQ